MKLWNEAWCGDRPCRPVLCLPHPGVTTMGAAGLGFSPLVVGTGAAEDEEEAGPPSCVVRVHPADTTAASKQARRPRVCVRLCWLCLARAA